MAGQRIISKQLGGVEDLLLDASGEPTVVQQRSSGAKTITKINADTIPYEGKSGETTFKSINTALAERARTVNTLDEMFLVDGTKEDTVFVKDLDRGGLFVYDATKLKTEDNGGTIFASTFDATSTVGCYVRQYNGAVNVKWFGAKGNLTPDDQPACQAALDYLLSSNVNEAKRSLYFPDGNFVFNAPLMVDVGSADTSLSLEIFGSGPNTVITKNFSSTIEQEGMFTFKADETAGINLRRIQMHDLKLNANLKAGSLIFGRILTACKFYNIWAGGHDNGTIDQTEYATIFLRNCAQVTVSDCVINHNPNTGGTFGGACIRLQSTNFGAGLDGFRSKNIFSNNIFGEQVKKGIVIDSEIGAADGANTISDNTFFHTFDSAIEIKNSDYNTITGNIFDDISMVIGTAYGILLDSSSNNVITGNSFVNAGTRSIFINSQNFVAEDSKFNVITSNTFKVDNPSAAYAIVINDVNSKDNTITNNSFDGVYAGGSALSIPLTSNTLVLNQKGASRAETLQGSVAASGGDTTPSVAGFNSILLEASTEYTAFDDGIDGQLLFVRGGTGSIVKGSGSLRMAGGADFLTIDSNSTIFFLYFGGAWWEISRNYGTAQNRGTVAPTTGNHVKGEIVWNSGAVASGTAGWICVTAGTPGTWKTFGAIEA